MLSKTARRDLSGKSRFAGKKIILTFSLLVLFTVLTNISSNPNPVVPEFINEFMLDTTGWSLEMHTDILNDSLSLDDWYLTSKTDTAYFNDGIYLSQDRYTIITQLDLQSPFYINEICDSLTLFNDEIAMDRLCFGNLTLYSVSTPRQGQSIRPRQYYGDYYYLDNSPTIGYENDTLNIKGNIEGYVRDSLNNPISGVKIIYGYIDIWPNPIQILYKETDINGYFNIYEYARVVNLELEKDSYFAANTMLQIWPDSIITLNIQMQAVVGITELPHSQINNFELSQNYPNPFNNSTTFIYSIAEDGYVEINIYDEKGELIQKLFNGNQTKRQYKVNWNADNLASGIYFYELKTRNQKIIKKCLLLK